MNVAQAVSRMVVRAVGTLLLLIFWGLSTREYYAHVQAVRGDEAGLKASVEADPHDALRRYWYGRYLLLERHDPYSAIEQFQHGLDANPRIADMWINLALAQLVLGRSSEVHSSLQRGSAAEPYNPVSLIAAANGYLVAGDTSTALQQFRKVVEADPSQTDAVLDQTWRSTRDLDSVLGQALPDTPAVRTRLLAYFTQTEDWTAVTALWPKLVAHHDALEEEPVRAVLRHLEQTDPLTAATAWKQAQQLVRGWDQVMVAGNLIANPGFETASTGSIFDWHAEPSPGVASSMDTTHAHGGAQSLRLDMNASNIATLGTAEMVLLQGGKTYELTFYLATDKLLSASMPMLSVEDPSGAIRYAASQEFPESAPWILQTVRFTMPQDASLAVLRLRRSTPETRIKGTLWLDDLHLAEAQP